MSKFKLTYTLSKYAGTKIKDIVKTLKSNNKAKKQPSKKALATKKSKANAERVGLGTKSIKRYNIRAGARNDKMVPIKWLAVGPVPIVLSLGDMKWKECIVLYP